MQAPKILPTPILSQLLICFNFIDNQINLYKIETVNPPNKCWSVLKDFRYVGNTCASTKHLKIKFWIGVVCFYFQVWLKLFSKKIFHPSARHIKVWFKKFPFLKASSYFVFPKMSQVASCNNYNNSTDGSVFVKNNI